MRAGGTEEWVGFKGGDVVEVLAVLVPFSGRERL